MMKNRLDNLTSLKVPSICDDLVNIDSMPVLQKFVRTTKGKTHWVLGGGSNVVATSKVPGSVGLIRLHGIRASVAGRGDARRVSLTVAAGENWHNLVRYTLGQGWSGLENLSLIPGSVGAAPIQNIGAYGVEVGSLVDHVTALDRHTDRLVELSHDQCEFAYRDSLFKRQPNQYVITSVCFQLRIATLRTEVNLSYPDLVSEIERMAVVPTPRNIAEAVIRVRRRKLPDPRVHPNVGSFFKNPIVGTTDARQLAKQITGLVSHEVDEQWVKLSAAQLIDRAGWKQRKPHERVGVWYRQPLVLTNLGAAKGADIWTAGLRIQEDVFTRFRVKLEQEPSLLGTL